MKESNCRRRILNVADGNILLVSEKRQMRDASLEKVGKIKTFRIMTTSIVAACLTHRKIQ